MRGSALLITILTVAFLSTVALAVGRLLVFEFRTATHFEDAEMAWSLAEAGLEDGLLRFRHNKSLELSRESEANPANFPSENEGRPVSFNLGPIANFAASGRYDLKIWYRGELKKGRPGGGEIILPQDQSLAVFLPDNPPLERLEVRYSFDGPGPGGNGGLEVIRVGQGGIIDRQLMPGSCPAEGCQVAISLAGLPEEVRFKPLGAHLVYLEVLALVSGRPVKIDTGTTAIESTGYFGAAKRKLRALVDRQSGRLLGIFDFTLFTEGEIKGP